MKPRKFVILSLTLLFLVSLSGCYDSSWSFDFKGATSDDLSDFVQLPLYFALDLFDTNPSLAGLVLNNVAVYGPFSFQGDLKLTLKFDLSVDEDFTADIAVALSSSASFAPVNQVKVELFGLGSVDASEFNVYDTGDTSGSDKTNLVPTSKPRINISGGNTLEMIKSGNSYTIKLNGSKIADFTAANCSSAAPLLPGFGSYLTGGQVTFTSIRVDYNK